MSKKHNGLLIPKLQALSPGPTVHLAEPPHPHSRCVVHPDSGGRQSPWFLKAAAATSPLLVSPPPDAALRLYGKSLTSGGSQGTLKDPQLTGVGWHSGPFGGQSSYMGSCWGQKLGLLSGHAVTLEKSLHVHPTLIY